MLVACQWPLKRATQLPGSVWYGGLEAHWGYLHYVEYLTYKLYVCLRNAYQIRTTDNWEKPYFNTYLCSYIWSGKIAIAPFHHIYNRVCFALMSRKSIAMLGNTHECDIEDFFSLTVQMSHDCSNSNDTTLKYMVTSITIEQQKAILGQLDSGRFQITEYWFQHMRTPDHINIICAKMNHRCIVGFKEIMCLLFSFIQSCVWLRLNSVSSCFNDLPLQWEEASRRIELCFLT